MAMTAMRVTRRVFVKQAAVAVAPVILRWDLRGAAEPPPQRLLLGVCADPHKDIMHDTDARLRVFIEAMQRERPEFIVQLGDFCCPLAKNRGFLRIWEEFSGPRYHTLGNHDRDGGFTWPQVMEFWGLAQRYYSFDRGGWHFVVLDGNEIKPGQRAPGYPRYIGAEQLAWLEGDLKAARGPTVVFSHQSLEDATGVENGAEVRAVLEKANTAAGWHKVGACLNGHHHIDFEREINGIHYVQINSMSYQWLGEQFAHVRYGPEIDRAHPSIKYTVPYKDALYATVTLLPEGALSIAGVRSEFVGPSPWELGMEERKGTSRDKARLVPWISDRQVALGSPPAAGPQ